MKRKLLLSLLVACLLLSLTTVCLTACNVHNVNLSFVVNDKTIHTVETSGKDSISIPDNPKEEGYTFDGWFWDKNVWANPFTANSLLDAPISSDMNVYAKMTPIEYSITYNLDGGASTNPVSYNVETTTITLSDAVKTGYTFDGWYKESTHENKVDSIPQGSVGNVELHAKYTINQYTISFNSDGGTEVTDITQDYNTAVTTPTAPEKFGYDFDGWYADNSTKEYDFTTMPAQNISLKAKWTPTQYSITYNLKGGTNGNNLTTYTIETSTITLADATKAGYTFDGWFDGETKIDTIEKGSVGNISVTAKWTPIEYSITYENTKSQANSNPTKFTVESTSITLTNLEKLGYTFNGWYNGSAKVTTIPTGTVGNITLTASWTTNDYDITYHNVEGATNSNPKVYNVEDEPLTFVNASKTGYKFLGWYTDSDYKNKIEIISIDNIGNKDIFAKWEAIQYTANFKDGDTIVDEIKFTVETKSLNEPAVPSKKGYTAKWAEYVIVADNITIAAVYTPITYTIDYQNTKGAVNSNATKYTIESEVELSNIVIPNYKFEGWFDSSNNPISKICVGQVGNIALTAKWTPYVDVEKTGFCDKTFVYDGNSKKLECDNIPDGITVEYTRNQLVNVGSLEVTATFYVDGIFAVTKTATLTISKANYDMSNISFVSKSVVYNGEPQSIFLDGTLPLGIDVTYKNNAQINVGRYLVVASFSVTNNYYELDDMIAYITIEKATYDMSNITFNGKSYVYDGNQKSLQIEGDLPQDVTVSYAGNNQSNVGTYTVTAKFINNNNNYCDIPDKQASLVINKATYDMSGITFKNKTVEYNGCSQSLSIEGDLPDGVNVVYENNDCINVGKYTAIAKFVGDGANYNSIPDKTATLTIIKGMPQVIVTNNQELNVNSQIELIAETEISGSVVFNDGQSLKLGQNLYGWTFTPTDTDNWNVVNGTINLNVRAIVNFYNNDILFETKNIALGDTIILPEKKPTKEDSCGLQYTFNYWSYEKDGEAVDLSNQVETNMNLYSVFSSSEIRYSITYENTKEAVNNNEKSFTVSSSIALQELETNHYEFLGWYNDADLRVESVDKGTYGDITLTAKWKPIQYTINYELGYWGILNSNTTTYNVEDNIDFVAPQFDEYHSFCGWYIDEQCTTLKPSVNAGEYGDVTLYAKWQFMGKSISTAQEFQNILYDMSGAYELKNNITVNFTLGDATNPFTGYFFGNDYTIILSVTGTDDTNISVFGVNDGEIRNVRTTELLCNTNNGTINFCTSSGGFAELNNGTISNCSSTGYVIAAVPHSVVNALDVHPDGFYRITKQIGGIASVNTGSIINCVTSANMNVSGNSDYAAMAIGGIAGFSSGKIENCLSNCNINATYKNTYSDPYRGSAHGIALYCGGLVGYSKGSIKYCYTRGTITTKLYSSYYIGDYNSKNAVAGYITSGLCGAGYGDIEKCFVAIDSISSSADYLYSLSYIKIAQGSYYNQDIKITQSHGSLDTYGKACNILNFISRNYMINTLKWSEYNDENNVIKGNVWIFKDGKYPQLYFEK